jgi:hypothetical protein
VYAQRALFDENIWPNACHQVTLLNDLPRTFREQHENFPRPAAQGHWYIAGQQQASLWIESKVSERDLLPPPNTHIFCRHYSNPTSL